MKIYSFKTVQQLPISMAEAWDFFSSPANLKEITPKEMQFQVLNDYQGERMYQGQVINYFVRPLLSIPLRWTTEITHVKDMEYFIDEQRFGPFAFWHHKHFFKEIPGGVEMSDFLHYAVPFGVIGRIANSLMVASQLKEIFEYRFKVLESRFGKMPA